MFKTTRKKQTTRQSSKPKPRKHKLQKLVTESLLIKLSQTLAIMTTRLKTQADDWESYEIEFLNAVTSAYSKTVPKAFQKYMDSVLLQFESILETIYVAYSEKQEISLEERTNRIDQLIGAIEKAFETKITDRNRELLHSAIKKEKDEEVRGWKAVTRYRLSKVLANVPGTSAATIYRRQKTHKRKVSIPYMEYINLKDPLLAPFTDSDLSPR